MRKCGCTKDAFAVWAAKVLALGYSGEGLRRQQDSCRVPPAAGHAAGRMQARACTQHFMCKPTATCVYTFTHIYEQTHTIVHTSLHTVGRVEEMPKAAGPGRGKLLERRLVKIYTPGTGGAASAAVRCDCGVA